MQTHLERSGKILLSREQVFDEVRRLVPEQASLPAGEIREEHDLIGDLGYDSLDVVELAMELEEHFKIRGTRLRVGERRPTMIRIRGYPESSLGHFGYSSPTRKRATRFSGLDSAHSLLARRASMPISAARLSG
jgi:acyl carrier protein